MELLWIKELLSSQDEKYNKKKLSLLEFNFLLSNSTQKSFILVNKYALPVWC